MVVFHEGGGLEFHIPILKNDFFENHLESFPDWLNFEPIIRGLKSDIFDWDQV